jgi:hypothetical protein
MKKSLHFILVVAVILAASNSTYSQLNRKQVKKNNKRMSKFEGQRFNFKNKSYNSVGISLNAFNYYGDLSPTSKKLSTDLGLTRPAIGFSFVHRFGPFYQLVGSFMYGGIRGSDNESADSKDTQNGVFRYNRNLSFRNRLKELSVVAQVDLFKNKATYISRVNWTPYLYAGIAVFHHNPQAQEPEFDAAGNPTGKKGEWVNLQPLGTEGQNAKLEKSDYNYGINPYKRIQIAIPMGLGVRFKINQVMDFATEFGFRYTFTDYLDDVSGHYVDLGVFENDDLARAMSHRSTEVTASNRTYIGRDGQTYNVLTGYGEESKWNMRGNDNDKDLYMVTTFRLTYIVGKTFHRAKFR